jgi:RimJ/RimL family protein N-acetyltransferase
MYNHKDGIYIRKLQENDLQQLLYMKSTTWTGTHTSPLLNLTDQKKWFDNLPVNSLCIVCCDQSCAEENIVGFAYLTEIDWISRIAKISATNMVEKISRELVQKCCAAVVDFSFEFLNLHKLEAEVLESNYVSQNWEINYLGFKIEGIKRQSVYKFGRYYDHTVTVHPPLRNYHHFGE